MPITILFLAIIVGYHFFYRRAQALHNRKAAQYELLI